MVGTFALTASADNYRVTYSSSGAFVAFDKLDGCTYTSGILFTETTPDGPFGGVLATVEDVCDDSDFVGVLNGGGPVTYSGNGLQSATASGTIEATSYNGLPPATFEFSLSFEGTGAATTQHTHGAFTSPGGSVDMSFDADRMRMAAATGTLTIDGESLDVTNAFIGSGTSGSLSIAR